MAPPLRKQPSRSGPLPVIQNSSGTIAASGSSSYNPAKADALTDFQNRRIQRRLEDLERTNPTDIPASFFLPESSRSGHASGVLPSTPTTAALPLLSTQQQQGKKKQSGNVRKILYAKKNLKDWLDELPASPTPPYLLAVAPPPSTPIRKLCSSCGYIGAYKCPRCGEWSCDRICLETHERDGGCGVRM